MPLKGLYFCKERECTGKGVGGVRTQKRVEFRSGGGWSQNSEEGEGKVELGGGVGGEGGKGEGGRRGWERERGGVCIMRGTHFTIEIQSVDL